MFKPIAKIELENRLNRFYSKMKEVCPDWDTAIILSKVNQYYFTGTMQDGILVISRQRKALYFVRRSFERAKAESLFADIYSIESYRDAAAIFGSDCGNTYLETEIVTWGIMERLKKCFKMRTIGSLDRVILAVRAVKTSFEIEKLEYAGKQHNDLLQNIVPELLKEGMSEADLVAQIYVKMMDLGHQGICRFSMFQTEMVVGQIGFGESSIYPTCFDGPGGAYGMYPSVPLGGSRERKLHKGDLVFVDIGFGYEGYHTDKTQVYIFGSKPSERMMKAQRTCMEIQSRLAEMLKTGTAPSNIYNGIINDLQDDFRQNFMGFGQRQVKFLGHGVGLHVDELPVIANGFSDSLVENMVIALEPKKGLPGIGMVGVEDTYIVTEYGGRCITGGGRDIIQI